jgi:hypothetical protein
MNLSENDIVRNQDYDCNVIFVVNSKGILRKIPMPCRMRSIVSLPGIPIKTWVQIEQALMTKENNLAYVYEGRIYPHHFFEIIIRLE